MKPANGNELAPTANRAIPLRGDGSLGSQHLGGGQTSPRSAPLEQAIKTMADFARIEARKAAGRDRARLKRLLAMQGEIFLMTGLMLLHEADQ